MPEEGQGPWPLVPADMPLTWKPRDLDFGNAGHGSARLGVLQPHPWLFSKSRRHVYMTGEHGQYAVDTERYRFEIPVCWQEAQVASGEGFETSNSMGEYVANACLGDGIAFVWEAGTAALLCPLGWNGEWGLARLDLLASEVGGFAAAPESFPGSSMVAPQEALAPVWTLHLNDDGGLPLTSTQRQFAGGIEVSESFVFVLVQAQGSRGVAVYSREHDSYVYVGLLQLPQLFGLSALVPMQLVVHETPESTTLWISLRITTLQASWGLTSFPRAVAYDLTGLDAASLGAELGADGGISLIRAVVQTPLVSDVAEARTFTGIDIGPAPDDGGTLLAISSVGVELFDVTLVVSGELGPEPEFGPFGLTGVDLFVVDEASRIATYAESAGPIGECGPPAGMPTTFDYPGVSVAELAESGLTLAGRYVTWGERGLVNSYQGDAMRLLAMYEPLSGGLELRRVGLLQPELGSGRQFEPLWRLQYDPVFNRLSGSARSYLGFMAFQLTGQDVVTVQGLCEHGATVSFYPSPSAGSGCGDIPPNSEYPTGEALQVTPFTSSTPIADQLPGNVEALLADEGVPWLVGYGYGGEWMDGTVISRERSEADWTGWKLVLDEVLLIADRGGCAIWAHRADVQTGQVLDARALYRVVQLGTVPLFPMRRESGVRDCAAGPWGDGSGDLRVAAVSADSPAMYFLRWAWAPDAPSGEFAANVPWRDIEVGSPGGGGMTGCTRVVEFREEGGVGEVTHFAAALDWWHRGTWPAQYYDDISESWVSDSWDLAFVPVSGQDTDEILYWRLPRAALGVDVDLVNPVVVVPDDPLATARLLAPASRLLVQDLIQQGTTIYALATMTPTNRGADADEPPMWLLVLEQVPSGTETIGVTQMGPSGALPPDWELHLAHILPLHTPGGLSTEQQRLFASPDGRFLTATTGSTSGGVFLIDTEPETGPEVVWGLRWGSTEDFTGFFTWGPDDNSLGLGLESPVEETERVNRYPRWPIDVEDPMVIPICQSAPFFEAGGLRFLVLDGDPMTVWRVTDEPEVQFVGGLAGRYAGRKRVSLSSSDALFMMGDMGCVAITPDDCATAPDEAEGHCAFLE